MILHLCQSEVSSPVRDRDYGETSLMGFYYKGGLTENYRLSRSDFEIFRGV